MSLLSQIEDNSSVGYTGWRAQGGINGYRQWDGCGACMVCDWPGVAGADKEIAVNI